MHKLFFLIGASGSGKTTAAKQLEQTNTANLKICYFDSIGIPSTEDMIREHGSGDEWQRVKTIEWVERIKQNYLKKNNVLLDGQTRPSFIDEACRQSALTSYEIILLDCSDETRIARLIGRGHAELANPRMMNWANYLREHCAAGGHKIIDTTVLSPDQSLRRLTDALTEDKNST